MDLSEYREQIDGIDRELLRLFCERMETSAGIAAYKKANSLPVLDPRREREKLLRVREQTPDGLKDYAVNLYSLLFELGRSYQNRLLGEESGLTREIERAITETPPLFPETPVVACQGVEGSYQENACDRLFRLPEIFYFSTFEAVFRAIEQGLCRYGVIPVENSTAGSVNAVYDLMMRYDFRIVRSVRLKIDHCLLAKPGVRFEEIREIYSHEQALSQCAGFLAAHPGIRAVPCENTATAAKLVADSSRRDAAALASRSCRSLYGLETLAESVQDRGNNQTRFVCISRDLEIYPGADRTSLMLVLPHKPGSLYKLLSRFYALGININKLESRPIPERNFEFMFYFDLETSVYAPEFLQLMAELPGLCESFSYLGSYSEVI